MPHALLLTGPRGIGKATLAFRFRPVCPGARRTADSAGAAEDGDLLAVPRR